MKHVALKQTGPSEAAFKAGFIRSIQEAILCGATEVLLIVPQKSNIAPSAIENVLGKAFVGKLLAGDSIPYTDTGVSIRARTLRTVELAISSGVILSVYVPPEDIEGVLAHAFEAKACVYVAWIDAELEQWTALKNPEILDAEELLKGFTKKA